MIRDDEIELYEQKIAEARVMSPGEKLLAGPRMFERWCELMREAIRLEIPWAGPSRVEEMLRDRIRLLREDDGDRYVPLASLRFEFLDLSTMRSGL
jgi:hypothetical protein